MKRKLAGSLRQPNLRLRQESRDRFEMVNGATLYSGYNASIQCNHGERKRTLESHRQEIVIVAGGHIELFKGAFYRNCWQRYERYRASLKADGRGHQRLR
jgi:hypothetical protein